MGLEQALGARNLRVAQARGWNWGQAAFESRSPPHPMSLQARGEVPTTGRKIAPRLNMASNFVDYRGDVVLLLLGGKALAFVKDHLLLRSRDFALLGLGNRCDEFGPAPTIDDSMCGLTVRIQFPVPRGGSYGEFRMG
jgi:hypothetical protein